MLPAPKELQRLPLAEVLTQLRTTPTGLTQAEAAERLEALGPNENRPSKQGGVLRLVLRRFASPLVGLLLAAAALSAALGDFTNSAIIAAIVAMSITLEAVQTRRSMKTADALREKVALTATTCRDGKWQEVPRRELVVGDLIRLSAGDMVPGDAWLLEAKDLHMHQAALTGESLPLEKEAAALAPSSNDVSEPGAVFVGSSVVSGHATAVVVATGARTAYGDIAARLTERPPDTEFEKGMAHYGAFVLKTVLFLVLFVFATSAFFHRDALQSFLFALALAVGLTPEFLPMITTVTLSRGALRMAARKVIVKNLASIQNLGSIDVLCSDKTGTLTRGEMELERFVGLDGQQSPRVLRLAWLNASGDTGEETATPLAVKKRVDPLDAAVLRHEHPSLEGWKKIDEVPFDFERRRVSVVVERGAERLLISKGAAEAMMRDCTGETLDPEQRERGLSLQRELSSRGFRVVAVASKTVAPKAAYGRADETGLTLDGFLAFSDPPLPEAKEAIAALQRDGVTVKVLSGDSDLVARHVCQAVGLDVTTIALGDEIEGLSDIALAQLLERVSVFARLNPLQKNRLVKVLREHGHVVGYLGDGINDALPLRNADVGISVHGAADVAREAAPIVLMERGLDVLHAGIIEGRRAFGNVTKYLLMGTSSNFGNVLSMAAATAVLPFLPMLPQQILLNNLLYDSAQLTIPSDDVDAEFLARPQPWRLGLVRRFTLWVGPVSSLYDFLTFFVLLKVFHAGEVLFHTGWFIESLATQTLVIFAIRTLKSPFSTRPSKALVASTLAVVALATALPFSPLAHVLGFVAPPATFLLFVAIATATYVVLVELVKRWAFRKLRAGG